MDRLIDCNNKLAVIVISCDKYEDLWLPFFQLFKKFWPDCPFQVYLLCNMKEFSFPGVITIKVGNDISWSDNLKTGLGRINEEYVLMFIDDLFLRASVQTPMLREICNEFIRVNGNYIRLNPTIRADTSYNDYFGKVSPGTIYRTSTVLSLWKKSVLFELLKSGETAWEFEIFGSVRSDVYDGFYASWENCFSIVNGVIKGKWQRKAYHSIRALCPEMDLQRRKLMTLSEEFVYRMKIARGKVLNLLPAQYRRKIKHVILAGNYNYKLHEDTKNKS